MPSIFITLARVLFYVGMLWDFHDRWFEAFLADK